jgi:AraC-like DNA-binding protein
MSSNIIVIVLVLGCIQGAILSANLVFSKDDRRQARYFLAAMIAIIAFEVGRSAWGMAYLNDHCTIHFFTLCLTYLVAPNLHLYVRSLTQTEKISRLEILRHHIVSILAYSIATIVLFYHLVIQPIELSSFSNAFKIGSLIVFWVFYRKAYADFYVFKNHPLPSDLNEIEIQTVTKWLELFLNVIFYIALLWSFATVTQYFGLQQIHKWAFIVLEVVFVVAIYWVGYAGFQRIKVVYLTEQRNTQAFFSTIQENEISLCLDKLRHSMETDKQYLDPELSLQKLADSIRVSYKVISAVLNQKLEMGFNEYVNQYRVEEFKQRILDPRNAHLNIASVAFDSGFNSLATFQRSFKAITGITPKEFMKQ